MTRHKLKLTKLGGLTKFCGFVSRRGATILFAALNCVVLEPFVDSFWLIFASKKEPTGSFRNVGNGGY